MLTIQSNLKIQDLETLSKTLIKPDIINFGLNKVGGGYTDKIADKVIAKLSKLDKDKIIVIINDITLQMVDKLLEAGYKNIYLAFGGFNKDGTVSKDKTVYNIMKAVIENNIKEKLNTITLEEIFNMKIKFDGIIANPPYGPIGANITQAIIDNVEFDDNYINLMPMIDYEKCKNKYELFKHVDLSSITSAPGSFSDAGISPIICKLTKSISESNISLSANDFRIQCCPELTRKYFKNNSLRQETFYSTEQFANDSSLLKTIALPLRVKSGNHGGQAGFSGRTDKSVFYTINKNIKTEVTDDERKSICCSTINFNTEQEKINCMNFLYSEDGFKFASWLMTDMNRDVFHVKEHRFWFPKVDWTHSWTVKEILKEYEYEDDEVNQVMMKLEKLRGTK